MSERPSRRAPDELRPIRHQRGYVQYAEGSVLYEQGATRVLCTATFESGVPRWLKGTGSGWVTAEYGMLPRATGERTRREARSGGQGGRTMEIQRLIGRALRAVLDLEVLKENTLTLDCDVLQADGGTRTAAINGAFMALQDAVDVLREKDVLQADPVYGQMAAVSVGIVDGEVRLDLDYAEDSTAETDMNVVMNDAGSIIEIQGTAEGHAFQRKELDAMLDLAEAGIREIMQQQRQVRAR